MTAYVLAFLGGGGLVALIAALLARHRQSGYDAAQLEQEARAGAQIAALEAAARTRRDALARAEVTIEKVREDRAAAVDLDPEAALDDLEARLDEWEH